MWDLFLTQRLNILVAIGILVLATPACKNNFSNTDQPPQTKFLQPVTKPLIFDKVKKIDFSSLKTQPVKPLVEKFDLDKIPSQPYDSLVFKPLAKPVTQSQIDFNALPEKDLDIDKIPSKPLKFKTYILPLPKLIKAGLPRLKSASTLAIYELGEAQGLQGSTITLLHADHAGFLWIATNLGLYRYDGESLLLYLPVVNNNNIIGMLEDNHGQIWMSTFKDGIEIFNPAAGTLKKLGKAQGTVGDSFYSIIQDRHQKIWASTSNPGGVNIIDPEKLTVKVLNKSNGLSNSIVNRVMQDNHGNIWAGTGGGANVINLDKKKIKYFDRAHGLPVSDTIDALMCDHAGRMWIAVHGGAVNILDAGKNTIRTAKDLQQQGNTIVMGFSEDNKGRVWASTTTRGIGVFNLGDLTFLGLKKASGLNSDRVLAITHDDKGQEWIGTGSGLNVVGNNNIVKERIGKTPTGGVAEDDEGLIWQSIDQSINIIDRKAKAVKNLTTRQGLGYDSLQTVQVFGGRIFISHNQGLDIIDKEKKTISHFTHKKGLINKVCFVTFVDKAGNIWFGGDKGIDIYDPVANSTKNIGAMQGLPGTFITAFAEDWFGRIWAGSAANTIIVMDFTTGTLQYLNATKDVNTFRPILTLQDSKGDIWIGGSNGVFFADVKAQTLTSFTAPQGLVNTPVISLLQHNNHIYAGTNNGVTMITPPAQGITAPKKWNVNSYRLNKINVGGFATDMVTRDGLYWWGDNGLTALDLLKKDTAQSIAYITGIKIMDQPEHFIYPTDFEINDTDTLWGTNGRHYTKGQVPLNTGYSVNTDLRWDKVESPYNMPLNLHLPYNKNLLQFQFSSASLNRLDTSWYSYKLLGADTKWSEITNELSTRNYYNLSPGSYTFEVVTKNNNNTWSKPAKFDFTINPPWWQTWWAYILYAIAFMGTIWCFVYFRSRKLMQDKRVLEQKVHVRTAEVMQQKAEIEAQRDNLEIAFQQLKTAQTQLIQSEKMASLGELTAGIAHEIQNPLNFVNNFSEVSIELLDELKEEAKAGNSDDVMAIAGDLSQNLQKINDHGKRADSIVKGMLQHSQSSSGKMEPTDINALANEYLRLSYHGLRAKDKTFNAEMTTRFDPKLPKVNVIPQDMGRVMLNLFNNAFYAVNQQQKTANADYKPEITVTTAAENGQVIIKVKDNGIGIPDAIKDKIMQPFFTTKPTGEGTGLGLSLTYDMVVKGHGGSIELDARPGEFTEFIIKLPLTIWNNHQFQ
jgi:signal transduction histidine kinase/ligand-binding sensor domain-containing protein